MDRIFLGTVIVPVGGAMLYAKADARRDRAHFVPGLNVKAPDKVGHGKTFEIKVAVANEKKKPQKD